MCPHKMRYRMPAEWDPHSRTFISWPVRASMVYPDDYARVCTGYAGIIRAVAEFEPVTIIANDDDMDLLSAYFPDTPVDCVSIGHNDSWLRDNGPTFLVNDRKEVAGVNWRFNAWGGKYEPYDLDDKVATKILHYFGLPCIDAPLVMEGGSIHVDGEGTLLTTEECLLNVNRNPDLDRGQITDLLKRHLGIRKIIWLKKGLVGDETDGHVDNVACFASPGKVLIQTCDDPNDENEAIFRENLAVLKCETDAWGRKLQIIPVPQPPELSHMGKRLTLSYLNFYLVNGGVILPVFGGTASRTDGQAIRILRKAFPDRRIVTVDGMALIREGGNVHCTTQQMPAVKKGLV